MIVDLTEIPLLVRAEVAQTPSEEVQDQTHLIQERERAEVEVLVGNTYLLLQENTENEKNLTFYLVNISTHF